jgi:hypothetical protein
MNPRFEVQEYCICGGWTNHWTTNDEPTYFDSEAEAQAELDEYLKDCQDEVEEGNMEDAPDREEFRIVEVV